MNFKMAIFGSSLVAAVMVPATTATGSSPQCITDGEIEAAVGEKLKAGAFAVRTDALGDRPLCSGLSMPQAIQKLRAQYFPSDDEPARENESWWVSNSRSASEEARSVSAAARQTSASPAHSRKGVASSAKAPPSPLNKLIIGEWDVTMVSDKDPGRCVSSRANVRNQYMIFRSNLSYEYVASEDSDSGSWNVQNGKVFFSGGPKGEGQPVKVVTDDLIILDGQFRYRRCKF